MSRRSAKRAHPRIPKNSRQVREIDVLGGAAEQDGPAVEEKAHGRRSEQGPRQPPDACERLRDYSTGLPVAATMQDHYDVTMVLLRWS